MARYCSNCGSFIDSFGLCVWCGTPQSVFALEVEEVEQGNEEDVEDYEEQDEPEEPTEGDLCTENDRDYWEYGSCHRHPAFTVKEDESLKAKYEEWCEDNGVYPSVWSLSDHGNWHLRTELE